jgi:hypothetical protein
MRPDEALYEKVATAFGVRDKAARGAAANLLRDGLLTKKKSGRREILVPNWAHPYHEPLSSFISALLRHKYPHYVGLAKAVKKATKPKSLYGKT